jgi:ubiquinone/menaquinone biosynthesis C-methylase UbiE
VAQFDVIEWIDKNFDLEPSDSGTVLYGEQDSLSNRAMPGIYRAFDPHNDRHVVTRGKALDFAEVAGSGKVLDFGPGEGFPSLVIAPLVSRVVGVEGSQQRTNVCDENARRLGIGNAEFVHIPPGNVLPFPAGSFDGAVACWSIEQSPQLALTLHEIARVLKAGASFRFEPETLRRYAGGHEREAWFPETAKGSHILTIFDRDVSAGRAKHYCLLVDSSRDAKEAADAVRKRRPGILRVDDLTLERMERLRPFVLKAATWTTEHPSLEAWPERLRDAGFGEATVTYSGGTAASQFLESTPQDRRPGTLQRLDDMLKPLVASACRELAPAKPEGEAGIFVTAVK